MNIKIAIFASGSGTNAENIIQYFKDKPSIQVSLILSNKADAFVLERAKQNGIPSAVFAKQAFTDTDEVLSFLREREIDFIVLAGFLLRVPDNLLRAYINKIMNIHPSLLPKYGGKGMYGDKVHEAVVAAGETESGITIHYIDEHYDEGSIIFQAVCRVSPLDTSHEVATKVHALEYKYYPSVIEDVLQRTFAY